MVWRPESFCGAGIRPERHEFISRSGRFWRVPIIDFGSSRAGEPVSDKLPVSLGEGRPRNETGAFLTQKNQKKKQKVSEKFIIFQKIEKMKNEPMRS